MKTEFLPFHRFLEFMSPLSGQRASKLVDFVAGHSDGTVVDVGCGWAALLTQLLVAKSTIRGVGLDLNDSGFPHAMQCAQTFGVAERLRLEAGDAKANLPSSADGAICIGATQVWKTSLEREGRLEYSEALSALRSLVVAGAPVVYGEAIWSIKPSETAAAQLGGRLDEFCFLPELLELAWNSGFSVVQVHEANQDEWDHFESGYTARYAEWLANSSHGHPEYGEVR